MNNNEQRRIVSYLDGLQAKVNAFPLTSFGDDVRELQSQSQVEVDALLPSVLDRAFRGESCDPLCPLDISPKCDGSAVGFGGELEMECINDTKNKDITR